GSILLCVPNDYSPLQTYLLENKLVDSEYWWHPPDHLNYFNKSSLMRLLEHTGYRVKDVCSSFPIDFYLMHPNSNYYQNSENGKLAHKARLALESLMFAEGIDAYFHFCQALAGVNMGRNLIVLAEK